jgi:hypothetical protein
MFNNRGSNWLYEDSSEEITVRSTLIRRIVSSVITVPSVTRSSFVEDYVTYKEISTKYVTPVVTDYLQKLSNASVLASSDASDVTVDNFTHSTDSVTPMLRLVTVEDSVIPDQYLNIPVSSYGGEDQAKSETIDDGPGVLVTTSVSLVTGEPKTVNNESYEDIQTVPTVDHSDLRSGGQSATVSDQVQTVSGNVLDVTSEAYTEANILNFSLSVAAVVPHNDTHEVHHLVGDSNENHQLIFGYQVEPAVTEAVTANIIIVVPLSPTQQIEDLVSDVGTSAELDLVVTEEATLNEDSGSEEFYILPDPARDWRIRDSVKSTVTSAGFVTGFLIGKITCKISFFMLFILPNYFRWYCLDSLVNFSWSWFFLVVQEEKKSWCSTPLSTCVYQFTQGLVKCQFFFFKKI